MLDEENGVGMDFVEQVGGEGGHGFSVGVWGVCGGIIFTAAPRVILRGGLQNMLTLSHNLHYVK